MKKTIKVRNEVQVIQKVLEEYLGNRKAAKVAVEISVAVNAETQHKHSGEVFFVHKDEAGNLVLTMESSVKENVQAILNSYLEEDEAQECIEQLMAENCETKATTEFETIKIPGSDSPIYEELLKHKVLEEYLGNQKVAKVAVEISAVMQGETQHTHNAEVFFVHKDEAGKLVLTMESSVKENVQAILNSYLEEDEAQECIEQLMAENCETKATTEFETIKIPGSDSPIYEELLKHSLTNDLELSFIRSLKKAISKSVKGFEVFVNDPSMDDNGKLQFVPGFKPAVGYSFNECYKLAKENGLRLGTNYEYILFLGWLITSLINEGWSEADAWYAVFTDSTELGHYCESAGAKEDLELTGSRKVVGKCDLANTFKILDGEEKSGYWCASGYYKHWGFIFPLSCIGYYENFDFHDAERVGWFVR